MLRTAVTTAAVLAAGAAAALGLLARTAGDRSFPTDPVALAALVGAGLSLVVLRSRRGTAQDPLGRALQRSTGGGLLVYALLGAAAASADAAGGAGAGTLAALWGAAWVPPLVTASAAALAASAHRRWVPRLLAAGAAMTTATVLLQEPVAPFDGLPTAAPGAWRAGGVALDVLSLLLAAGVVAVPVALAVAGVRAGSATLRARCLLLSLGASCPVLVAVVCVLLAAARDPGGVAPSTGSTGFLVVLAAGCAAGCWAVRAAAQDDARGSALVAARCWAGAVVVLVVLGGGVVTAGLLDGAPLLLVVGAVGVLTAAGSEGWRRSTGWARAALAETAAEPPTAPTVTAPAAPAAPSTPSGTGGDARAGPRERSPERLPAGWTALTPREREVLASLASGATNAGIAEALAISPRTVEAHLRSVFVRLGLDEADGSNRRNVAARLWLQHGQREQRGEGPPHPARPAVTSG